jgi:hypothetical protein
MMEERGIAVGLVERRETEGPTRSDEVLGDADMAGEDEAAGVDADADVARVEDIDEELETCRA